MAHGINALKKLQLSSETVAGTQKLATTVWRGLASLRDDKARVFPSENPGIIGGTGRTYAPKAGVTVELASSEATYEQLPTLFEMGLGNTTGVKDGSGSGYAYTYTLPYSAATIPSAIQSYSAEAGDNQRVEFAPYLFCKSIKLSGAGRGAWMNSATLEGRAATINTYTADTISFTASTKKIADSADGLIGFVTGMTITVTGSTLNDGTYTVATGGVDHEIVVTETLVDEVVGDSVTVAQTFTGTASYPTVSEILFGNTKFYLDAIGGSYGGTQITSTLLKADIDIASGWKAHNGADGRLDFGEPIFGDSGFAVKATLAMLHNANAVAEMANWRAGTARKLRLRVDSNTALATAGTTYTYKTLIIDLPGVWESFDNSGAAGDDTGSGMVTGVFRMTYNATVAASGVIVVVNELSAIP